MKPGVKAFLISMIAALTAVALSGCMRIAADDLYSLPIASEEYLRLQRQINSVLDLGAEFAAPAGGPNRQAVQFKDLNGDGVSEVVAFFSQLGDSKLMIYIFEYIDGDYSVTEVIEGVGSGFESVRYADMDGDGIVELIVGWQMGAALKHMTIFSIKDFHSVLLAERDFTEISVFDLLGNGNPSVIVLRLPTPESVAMAEMFSLMPDGEVVSYDARLSYGIEAISRVLTGKLIDGAPALFVDSTGRFDDGVLVTDICVFHDGGFENISAKSSSGISEETVRTLIGSSDVNKDGIVKVPMPRRLRAQSETPYYAIDWYAYNSLGHSSLALTTYHNNFDEWFLIMPFDWRGKVSIRREDIVSGERTVVFSYIAAEDGPYEDFLAIHKIFGETREERATSGRRVRIMSDGASVFAFELLTEPDSFGLTFNETLIMGNFMLIHSEWLEGMG